MWFIVFGIIIGIVLATIASVKNNRDKKQPLTKEEQDIVEHVAIIQPIIRDDLNKNKYG